MFDTPSSPVRGTYPGTPHERGYGGAHARNSLYPALAVIHVHTPIKLGGISPHSCTVPDGCDVRRAHTTDLFLFLWRITINADPSANISENRQSICHARRQEPDIYLHPGEFAVSPLGILQRDDRRHGQAFPGGAQPQQIAIRLGAVRALSRLLPDVAAGRMAGNQTGVQGRHHCRPAHRGGGRILVHPRHAYQCDGEGGKRVGQYGVRGLSRRRVHHRHRVDVSGNHRQPLHDGAGRSAVRGHAHQSRAVLQRHRLDLRSHHRQHVFLLQGCRGQKHRQPDALYSLRGRRRWW